MFVSLSLTLTHTTRARTLSNTHKTAKTMAHAVSHTHIHPLEAHEEIAARTASARPCRMCEGGRAASVGITLIRTTCQGGLAGRAFIDSVSAIHARE
jgi:hypothetical protein